jgi:predicted DNA-binding transcriptional regulator AlpA
MAPELKRGLQRRAQGGPPDRVDKKPDPSLAAQGVDKNLADAARKPTPAGSGPKYVPPQHALERDRGGVVAAPPGPPLTGRRFLSYDDLVARGIRFSRPHLRRLENNGNFPARVELGAGNDVQTSVAWVASEIEHWENEKIAKRDAKLRLRMKQTEAGVPAA